METQRNYPMEIRESANPGKVLIPCMNCGRWLEVADFRDDPDTAPYFHAIWDNVRLCDECNPPPPPVVTMDERLTASGFPALYTHHRDTGQIFRIAPVPATADWIWAHRDANLLVSGPAGCGKTTSACFAAIRMMRTVPGFTVRYAALGRLADQWRDACRADAQGATAAFLRETLSRRLVIIDECAGKFHVTPAVQEFFHELLEAVNSGSAEGRVWLLGNFTSESLEELMPDPAAGRRRLRENFSGMVVSNGRCRAITFT